MEVKKRDFLKSALMTGAAVMLATHVRAQEKIKIGFSQGTMNHPWRVAMVEGNKAYATKNLPDVDLIITDGQNESSKQVTDVESLMAQGISVLMISPLTADALAPVVADAMAAGIKVVSLDRKVNTEVTVHVGAENAPIGIAAGKFIAEKLNGTGKVIELQGTGGASVTTDRHDGFVNALKGTNVEIIAAQNCDFLRENAVKFMEDQLQRFGPGEIQAVYAHNDEMALGAIQALEAVGRLNDVIVVGIDGQNTAFDAIKEGKMAATFVYPYVAPEGMEIAYKVAKGEAVDPVIILPGKQVDASNVNEMIGKGF